MKVVASGTSSSSDVTVEPALPEGGSAEINTSLTLNGNVSVTDSDNYPEASQWGVNGDATQAGMVRVTPQKVAGSNTYNVGRLNGQPDVEYTYSCNSGDGISGAQTSVGAPATPTPTCVHTYPTYCNAGDSQSGSTCTHTTYTTYTATAHANYSCNAGDSLSGTTCSHTSTSWAAIGPKGGCAYLGSGWSAAYNGSYEECKKTTSSTYSATFTGYTYYCNGSDSLSGTTCTHTATSTYTATNCNAGDSRSGTLCTHIYNAYSTTHYWYLCTDGTHQSSGWDAAPTCDSEWSCHNNTSTVDTTDWIVTPPADANSSYAGSVTCYTWQCQYTQNYMNSPYVFGTQDPFVPNPITTNPPAATNCQARCQGGVGALPWVPDSSTSYTATQRSYVGTLPGTVPCYQPPSFAVRCTMTITKGSGSTTPQTVTVAGLVTNAACGSAGGSAGTDSSEICAYMTPSLASGWTANPSTLGVNGQTAATFVPPPGFSVADFEPPQTDESCAGYYSKPYVKIYDGDASAGNSSDATGTCQSYGTANISTWSTTGTTPTGAGAQYSVSATGTINGLISGAFNGFTSSNPSPWMAPNSLTFATNEKGSFSAPACLDVSNTVNTNTTDNADGSYDPSNTDAVTINGDTVTDDVTGNVVTTLNFGSGNSANSITRRFGGNVYIASNLTYGDNGTFGAGVDSIPSLQIVAAGDIYVDPSVTELDGLYVAGGDIYDCATAGGPITQPFDYQNGGGQCNNQLVVNGSFVADKVYLQRDYGSNACSTGNEATQYNGSSAPSYEGSSTVECTGGNNAAEIFNYSPETWIRGAQTDDTEYDSISNMPPIL